MSGHSMERSLRVFDVKRLALGVGVLVLAAGSAFAQEAALLGTITDETGGVLPGVAVSALHQATGNVFSTVTDGQGNYRIAARVGVYKVTGELPGFATITREGIEILVGQQAVLNLRMNVSTVAESVTVS